jgi:hypothetical protein
MWDPQHLTTLQPSTGCYVDSFTFLSEAAPVRQLNDWKRLFMRSCHLPFYSINCYNIILYNLMILVSQNSYPEF